MDKISFQCPKCSNTFYDKDEFRATGGMLSKIFNIQNKRFTTISCTKCKYTEVYKTPLRNFENVADFLFGQ